MKTEEDKIEEIHKDFENKSSVLIKKKKDLLLKYSQKLEELRIEKIRKKIFNK